MAQLPVHLASLMQPAAFPHAVRGIELVETHVSWVLLTGEFAYKIKRPVAYEFVDLRAAERRAFYCAEELRLNRRFAPELYLEVCDIRAEGDVAHIDGSGRRIETCVKMRQFPRSHELDRRLAAGQIEPAALERFGSDLAGIHAGLPVASANDPWGWPDRVRRGMLENIAQYEHASQACGFADQPGLRAAFGARLAALAAHMGARRSMGAVRECHGDLHTRNIVQSDSRLVAFDCMEFEPAFRWIDVAEEIALLLADLNAGGYTRHAHAFLSGYLVHSGDFSACRVLSLYMAHRALVRAKVAALEAAGAADQGAAARARQDHEALVGEVRRNLEGGHPVLVLMAGLSGSGKTWLARRLAPDLGAVHLRSDVERKRLAGLGPSGHSRSGIGAGLYTLGKTDEVYSHLAKCAEDVLAGGYPVIVDATFSRRSHRELFKDMAARLSVRMQVVLCDAPAALLRERIVQRKKQGRDASEADIAVLDWQLQHQEPITASEALDLVRVSTGGPDPVEAALRTLHPDPAH
jgi:uncharacterized protein